jgi:hypothetical protein
MSLSSDPKNYSAKPGEPVENPSPNCGTTVKLTVSFKGVAPKRQDEALLLVPTDSIVKEG